MAIGRPSESRHEVGEIVMGFFDVSVEKKRAKEIRKEGKHLRKELLAAGVDKKILDPFWEEYLICLEAACRERDNYKIARQKMKFCINAIDVILPQMSDISVAACKEKLGVLLSNLEQMLHDCLIRKDDMDFEITLSYLREKVPNYGAQDRLMMQSEIENLRAIFVDTLDWHAPEFVSLAYFLRHGEQEILAEMGNSQRNNYLENYFKEQFWDENIEVIERAGMLEKVLQFEKQALTK